MAIRTLSLPEKLDFAGIEGLKATLSAIQSEGELPSLLVLEGTSKETFCDGVDLASLLTSGNTEVLRRTYDSYVDLVLMVRRFPRPTIAVVRGRCLSGGLGLAAACDFLFANPDSHFALPEAASGLVPTILWPVVAERMAPQKLRALALKCRPLTAKSALRLGLADALHDDVEMARTLRKYDERLSRLDTESVRQIKAHSLDIGGMGLVEAIRRGREVVLDRIHDEPFRERLLERLSEATV